jgi:hypothetical protein
MRELPDLTVIDDSFFFVGERILEGGELALVALVGELLREDFDGELVERRAMVKMWNYRL